MKNVLFAAGGTMGHLGPAIAVANALRERAPDSRIVFVGTRSGVEGRVTLNFPWRSIIKVPMPRRFGMALFLFPFRLLIAVLQSLSLVMRSDVVVGFGGYVATPVYLAAWILRKRIILHEANALPGFANRVGKALGGECFANFERVATAWHCPAIGIPLRREIIELARMRITAPSHQSTREVLVVGGSQGSNSLNQAVWSALPKLLEIDEKLRIHHSVGPEHLSRVPAGLIGDAYTAVSYIDDMAGAYQRADLVIARGGAVTCAEILALGKRAIVVPLGHGNGEQSINAETLVESGNAISVPDAQFDDAWLVQNLASAFSLKPSPPDRETLESRYLNATDLMVDAILAGVRS